MRRLIELSRKAAEKIKESDNILLISHYDCDGLCSAAIMKESLTRLGKEFDVKIIKHIKPDIRELNKTDYNLIIFTDLGSGYLDIINNLNKDVIIADHHEVRGFANVIHLNPCLFDVKSLSGSCVTYLIAREFGNKDLSPIAIVGAVGDLENVNEEILKEAQNFGIKKEKGLRFFGRNRPIHKVLEYSFDPYIPGISGDESAAVQFLSKLGIKILENGKWRTLNDLTQDELQRLSDGLIMERLKNGRKAETIFGENYILKDFFDVREFATLINACGRLGEYEIGINLCLGMDNEKVEGIMMKYRKTIASYIDWVRNNINSEYIIKKNATYVIAKNNINENFIGTVISICMKSFDLGNTVVGISDSDDGLKISARTLKNIDLSKIVSEACNKVGGRGGGHKLSAGGLIPKGKEEEFINIFDELLKVYKY